MGTISVGEGRTAVVLRVENLGRDLAAFLTGGEAHVGAVAVAGRAAGTGGEALADAIVAPGNKDGPLAEEGAALMAALSGRTCVMIVGIHVEDATPAEIEQIVAHAREAFALWTPDDVVDQRY